MSRLTRPRQHKIEPQNPIEAHFLKTNPNLYQEGQQAPLQIQELAMNSAMKNFNELAHQNLICPMKVVVEEKVVEHFLPGEKQVIKTTVQRRYSVPMTEAEALAHLKKELEDREAELAAEKKATKKSKIVKKTKKGAKK